MQIAIAQHMPVALGPVRPRPPQRLAISVSKAVGNSPARARMRRLVREAFRALRGQIKAQVALMVLARKPWPEANLDHMVGELTALLRQVGVWTADAAPATAC